LRRVVRTDALTREKAAGSRGPVWLVPRAVAGPRHSEEAAEIITWCAGEGIAVTPRGAGTGMPGGNVGDDVVLDLSALDEIEWEDDDQVRAGAGVVAADLDGVARSRGLYFPALPSSAPWCTVGGMVATDAAGARSFRFGATHAWTTGLGTVRASGQRERHGSRPIDGDSDWSHLADVLGETPLPSRPHLAKNSSGYALERFLGSRDPIQLIAGSEGTLCVVTEVTVSPVPLPERRGVALLGIADLDEMTGLIDGVREAGATACEYFGVRLLELGQLLGDARLDGLDTRDGVLLVEFAGTADEVDAGLVGVETTWMRRGGAQLARDRVEVDGLWSLRHSASPAIAIAAGDRRSVQFIEDSVVPTEALPAYVRGIEAALARQGWEGVIFGHAGDGNLHVNPLVDFHDPQWRTRVLALIDEVVDLVGALGGTLSGEHGDGRVRAPFLSRVWPVPHLNAFHRVKSTLDPLGVLNPGVILPLEGQDPLRGFAAGPDLQRLAGSGSTR
jgi:FAD/FMN-containing dehydrogenase